MRASHLLIAALALTVVVYCAPVSEVQHFSPVPHADRQQKGHKTLLEEIMRDRDRRDTMGALNVLLG